MLFKNDLLCAFIDRRFEIPPHFSSILSSIPPKNGLFSTDCLKGEIKDFSETKKKNKKNEGS